MEELRNESYKECVVRNSNINFDGNKLIYAFLFRVELQGFSRPHRKNLMFFGEHFRIILIIVVVVYIVSIKVFKRTIGKTLLGVVILLTVNVIILVLTNATTVLIFVAAVLYIVYLVQTIVNIRKF